MEAKFSPNSTRLPASNNNKNNKSLQFRMQDKENIENGLKANTSGSCNAQLLVKPLPTEQMKGRKTGLSNLNLVASTQESIHSAGSTIRSETTMCEQEAPAVLLNSFSADEFNQARDVTFPQSILIPASLPRSTGWKVCSPTTERQLSFTSPSQTLRRKYKYQSEFIDRDLMN
jgi:hypothetical protein